MICLIWSPSRYREKQHIFKKGKVQNHNIELIWMKQSVPGLGSWTRPEYCIAPLDASHSQSKLSLQVLWHHFLVLLQASSHTLSYRSKFQTWQHSLQSLLSDGKTLCGLSLYLHLHSLAQVDKTLVSLIVECSTKAKQVGCIFFQKTILAQKHVP